MSHPAEPLSSHVPDLARAGREIFDAVACEAILQDRPLEITRPDDPLSVAVSLLWWRRVGALPVLDGDDLVGCFAEEDLLRVLAAALEAAPESLRRGDVSVWSPELLGNLQVADAMSTRKELPVVDAGTSLLEGLAISCGPDAPPGRYLFVVDPEADGAGLKLASFRDVARYLTQLYDGVAPAGLFGDPDAAERARIAAQDVLALSIGESRRRWPLGHVPNVVSIGDSAAQVIGAMATHRRGYILVTSPDGGPIGICTRRDVLRVCAPRFARLGALRLAGWMSPRVRTVTDTDTLFGLFKLMALESCRHMPLVDEWDRTEAVISMYEGIALVAGLAGSDRL